MNSTRIVCVLLSTWSMAFAGCGSPPVPQSGDVAPTMVTAKESTPEVGTVATAPVAAPSAKEEPVVVAAEQNSPASPIAPKADSNPTVASNSQAPSATEQAADKSALIGVWKWVGDRNTGSVNSGQYKHNLVTFYPDGSCTRFSEWNPNSHNGQYKVTRAKGTWRQVGKKIEVSYRGMATKDSTKVIDNYPYPANIVPGAVEHQMKDKSYTFVLFGNSLLRDDGNSFRRISTDPEADPDKIVDHEELRWRAIADEIYRTK